jgi:20S proteasome subunit beta 4
MEYLMGIKGKDFVVVVSDTTATQQIITIKHDEDKLVPIDSHKLMCLSGMSARQLDLASRTA